MKVYVASKFENKVAVKEAIRLLQKDGHTVTHDWTNEDFNVASRRGLTQDAYAAECADADFRGAANADVILLLADYDAAFGKMAGGFVEAGIGMGYGALVFCVQSKPLCIFEHLSQWHSFETLDDARTALMMMQRQRAH